MGGGGLLSALQASYLVGVSDPHSQSGHEGLVDPIQFARAHQAIQMACQNLVDPASSPSQVRDPTLGLKPSTGLLPGIRGLTQDSCLYRSRVTLIKWLIWFEKLKIDLTVLSDSLTPQHNSAYCSLVFFVHQVLSAATIVAKHTSALCNACRLASSKTSNPVARRQFVQSAKEVANTTANLVKTIKVNSPTDQNVECKFVTQFFSLH